MATTVFKTKDPCPRCDNPARNFMGVRVKGGFHGTYFCPRCRHRESERETVYDVASKDWRVHKDPSDGGL